MSPPYKRKDMKENEKKNIETPPVTEKIDEELCQEVLEKYSQEEVMRKGSGWYTKVISILALMMAVFHVYTSGFGLLETMRQRPIHLMFVMVLVFLMYPGSKKQENRGPSVIDVALSVLALVPRAMWCWDTGAFWSVTASPTRQISSWPSCSQC